MSPQHANPAGWPDAILPLLENAYTCEYATLTRKGQPLTYPITPHRSADGRTIDICTGLAYPLKADRARVQPDVTLLFSDATGSGLRQPPIVRVHARASVRDADLQANTDRYVTLSNAKFSLISRFIPPRWKRQGTWYFARIWVELTPTEILWWPRGDTDVPPQRWTAPEGTDAPPSDPPPTRRGPGKVFTPERADWRIAARYGLANLGEPVLTVNDARGRPVPIRMKRAALANTSGASGSDEAVDAFVLRPPAHVDVPLAGPACLTFHAHPKRFTSQENMVFVGKAVPEGDGLRFVVDRQVGSFSLGSSIFETARSISEKSRTLHKRLEAEAARRGQSIPIVR